uniref:Uncharacterized protein n=1 Tax=Setaria viridis TaxID=4556 RepID=A0A4U6VG03_SETVI|nr:hypothetical protein SEVIR_3G251050v2 [Setaria viridis]
MLHFCMLGILLHIVCHMSCISQVCRYWYSYLRIIHIRTLIVIL